MLLHSGSLGLAHDLLNIECCLLAASALKTASLCSSRQSRKDIHVCRRLPLVTWPFTPAHKLHLCILWQTQSHWDCVLVIALSWAFWASWSIWQVCSISTFWAWTSTFAEMVSWEPTTSWIFFNASDRLTTALASILHFLGSPFWSMIQRTATMCARYSSVFPRECVCVSGLRLQLGYCKCMSYQSLVPSHWHPSIPKNSVVLFL